MIAQWLGSQLALPTGFGGRVVAQLMNRWNTQINDRAVALLCVQPHDAVLEIGFGGGATLARLLSTAPTARVTGYERSSTMAQAARAKFATECGAGRLNIDEGDIEALPYPDRSFDRIVAVNVLYFWSDLPAALEEMRRVLRPDGTLVLAYRPATSMRRFAVTRRDFRLVEDQDLIDAAHAAGLEAVALESGPDGSVGYRCLVATPLV